MSRGGGDTITGEQAVERPRRIGLYIVVASCSSIIAHRGHRVQLRRENQRADEKAAELIADLRVRRDAGAAAEQIARVLGDDGGAVCAEPE